MANALDYAMDYPQPDNALAPPPSWADAADWHWQNLHDTWQALQDPQTWVDAASKYIYSLEGGLKTVSPLGNIIRSDVRLPGGGVTDTSTPLGKRVAAMVDEHQRTQSMPLMGAQANVPGGSDLVVTLPPGVTNPRILGARADDMVSQATAMTQGVPEGQTAPRYWYREGAGGLHASTGQDVDATTRLLAAHAVTSPQENVAGNTNKAVNAWNQSLFGGDITGSMGYQNRALNEILYGNTVPETRKTGQFFLDHMRYIEPALADSVTNDIWAMRNAGYTGPNGAPYSGTPSVGEDNYVRMMIAQATRRLNDAGVDGGGWTPDQVQAALWVHHKTLQETGQATPQSYTFANALERLVARQADPHQVGPALLGDAAGDPQAQAAASDAARGVLTDPTGRDAIHAGFGMLTLPGQPGAAVSRSAAEGVKQTSSDLMDASTLVRATLLRQPSALWVSHSDVAGLPKVADANVVQALGGDRAAVREALDAAGLHGAVIHNGPGGPRIINLAERTQLGNPQFQSAVKTAIKDAGLNVDLARARADYGYFTHDWDTDPTGSSYIRELGRLPANLGRVGDQLLARFGGRVDQAIAGVSGRQGTPTGVWTRPGFAQAVGPEISLPVRPWVQRPTTTGPGSGLPNLLGLAP